VVRTTLDLEDRALHAARAKAAAEKTSVGKAVSALVLQAVDAPVPQIQGIEVLPAVPGHVITDELVYAHRDDE
jgi:hypothetical protein